MSTTNTTSPGGYLVYCECGRDALRGATYDTARAYQQSHRCSDCSRPSDRLYVAPDWEACDRLALTAWRGE